MMSGTDKDSSRLSTRHRLLEVARNGDGTYQIVFNEELAGNRISEKWLDEELCAKRGFCGEELASIKSQLQESGRAVVIL